MGLKAEQRRTEEDKTVEVPQSEQQREKKIPKINCRTITKDLTFLSLESQKENREQD